MVKKQQYYLEAVVMGAKSGVMWQLGGLEETEVREGKGLSQQCHSATKVKDKNAIL